MTWLDDYGLAVAPRHEGPVQHLARVVGDMGGVWQLVTQTGMTPAKLAGALRHRIRGAATERPVVGDWVVIQPGDPALIRDVLPRRTQIIRKEAGRAERQQVMASNVDDAWIVCAVNEINLRKLERFVAIVSQGGVTPHLLLNKIDLLEDPAPLLGSLRDNFPQLPVLALQARERRTLQPLMQQLQPNRTFALIGASGVGKSTLVNALLGEALLPTGATMDDGRGQHTTTGRHLVRLSGGALLVDTPGLREVGIAHASAGVDSTFADIVDLAQQCRFADCHHQADVPGCAIAAALGDGALSRERFEAWQKLGAESLGKRVPRATRRR